MTYQGHTESHSDVSDGVDSQKVQCSGPSGDCLFIARMPLCGTLGFLTVLGETEERMEDR